MKAKIYDSGSIKTVLVQDDNGDKFITGLEELLDMMDGEDNWEIETTNSKPLTEKLYKYNKLMREVGEIRREIESYNNSKVFPVNDMFQDLKMEYDREVVDKYLKSNELQLGKIEPYTSLPMPGITKFPASTTRGEGKDFIGVHTGYEIKPASKEQDYTGMRVEIDGITGTVEYTDVYDGLALRFMGEEAGFLELTPDGVKMPRFEIDDIRMWVYMRQLQEGTWDVFDSKIGLGAQASTPGEAIKLYLEKLKDNKFVGRGYLNQVGITGDTRKIGEFNKSKNIINIEVVLKYNDLLKEEERDMTLSVNWMTLHGRMGKINRSEEGEYRLVFEDEEYHMVMLPTLHGNLVPLARIEHEGMMVMVVNLHSPDGYKWDAMVNNTPFIKEGAATPSEALTGLLEYIKDHKIPVEELNKLGIYSNTTTIGNNGKYSMINVQVAVRFEDIAMQGGEEEGPTLDVLFVFFNVKDINGELVPHFMIPSLNNDNAYIMEEGHDDPVSLVKKALGDYKLSEGDMKYLGWEGDTPPNLTREDINNMVKIDDCWVSVTRKVPKKLIARD